MGLFSTSFDPLKDLPDLSGKVALVTGGNAGIGYATVKHLARKGARVYMAARNRAKVEDAIKTLTREGLGPGNGEVLWLPLDLIDPRRATAAAYEFMRKETRLDVLIHNAALMMEPYQLTPDGIEALFTVNAISPFVLTRELMPILNRTAAETNADVRIVVVGSASYKYLRDEPRFRNVDDLNHDFKNAFIPWFSRYAYSKMANMLYTSELQRRLSAQGSSITVLCADPGAVNTFSRKPPLKRISWLVDVLVYPFFVHPDVGAHNIVFAAGSSEVVQRPETFKGAYLLPVGSVHRPAVCKPALAHELWTTIERFLADKGI